MSTELLPELQTEGDLESHPLPLLIALILDARLSGMLRFESEETRYWIYFDEGFPAGVHDPKSQAYLGSVLRELNLIDDDAFNQSLMKMAETKQLQGQVLIQMEAIDEEQLERGLSVQLARKLSRLFAIKQGTFEFIEDEEMPPPSEPIRVNPYALIYNAIRNTYTKEDLKKGLASVVGKALKVSRLFVERGPLFEFPDEDLQDARLLEDFRLPQDFVQNARCGPTAAMMMLLALLYCDMLEFEEADFAQPIGGRAAAARPAPAQAQTQAQTQAQAQAQPASPAARAAARSAGPAKSEAKPVSAELRRKIDEKFEQVKTAEPWQVLEVEQDADSARVKKAFLTLAKVYHPDRVANSGDEELSHRLDVIIAKVNEAQQIMSDPHARAAYMAGQGKQKGGQPGKAAGPRPQEAKIQFQKAMVFYKKKDYTKAAESLRWATEMDADEGAYLAWRHWVDFQRSDEAEDVRLDKVKGDLLALSKSQPGCFEAAQFLTRVYQKLGDKANYEKFLVKANKIDPKNVEIARELRLYRNRKQKAESKGKFLGIRFKKTED
jgi:curved DNA-binding protein CbpA